MNRKLEESVGGKIKIKIAHDDVTASPASASDRLLFEFADSMSSRNVVIRDDEAANDNAPGDSVKVTCSPRVVSLQQYNTLINTTIYFILICTRCL